MAYHIGQKVKIHGNSEGVIVRKLGATTYEVRLWDKNRLVGDVIATEHDLNKENQTPPKPQAAQ